MDELILPAFLAGLPRSPGVYIMKGHGGEIIYIGKAKNLATRVRSYFAPGSSDMRFIARQVQRLVDDIEVVLTTSEKEALLLENNLIKHHAPRYNVRLRDDKDYICLRLDPRVPWPKLEIVRRPDDDGAWYFGPYASAHAARQTASLVRRHFRLRACSDAQLGSRVRPCLQHQIHRCDGPCTLPVDQQAYRRQVAFARLFLQGRRDELVHELEAAMKGAAADLEYERAAAVRNLLQAVTRTLEPQRVVSVGGKDVDVVGLYREGDEVQIAVLVFRSGALMGRLAFHFSRCELPEEEILSSLLVQHYVSGVDIPAELAVPVELEDAMAISELLCERRGSRVKVTSPRRGGRREQLEMARVNALQGLKERLLHKDSVESRLAAIAQRLGLPAPPRRIECVDISHLAGTDTVGAISAVLDGQVSRAAGRTYKVKTASSGDDYAAMHEVLSRRFTRAVAGEAGWEPPDLLVVDGGRGQLGVAVAVLEDLGLGAQAVVALAKEHAETGGAQSDRIYLPGRKNPIPISARLTALYVLAAARDEAHRLAVRFQRKTRSRRNFASVLEDIEGVGPATRRDLLRHLGSQRRVREASSEELAAVPGVGTVLAERIRAHFAGKNAPQKVDGAP